MLQLGEYGLWVSSAYCKPLQFNTRHTVYTMAKPTSALRRAGASFVPSPVTATTSCCLPWLSWLSMIPFTRLYLSSGDDLASTRKCGHTWSKRPWSTCTTPESSSTVAEQNKVEMERRTGEGRMGEENGGIERTTSVCVCRAAYRSKKNEIAYNVFTLQVACTKCRPTCNFQYHLESRGQRWRPPDLIKNQARNVG